MRIVYICVVALLFLQLFFLANLQFTAWPEMLSYAYLKNHSFLIYKDMIHPYPPILTMGLSWVYSILGYDLWVLKVVAWIVILLSGFLVFLVSREVTKNDKYALSALGFYVLVAPFLEGNMLWFDIAIIPPILLSLLFILRNNLFLAGLFLAVAMLTKQTAGLFFVFSFLYLVFARKTHFSELKKIFYGPLILGVPLLVRLIQEGTLIDFLRWVLIYPLTKWGSIIGYVQMELSSYQMIVIFLLFAPLLVGILTRRVLFVKDSKIQLLILFLVVSLFAVYPRFSFFHFQTAITLLAILYGYMLSKTEITRLTIAYCLLPSALVFFLIHQPVISSGWQKEARFYGSEDLQLAGLIADKTTKNDTLFLLGLNSSLYAMSNRIPPKRWADNFSWYLEIPGVQEEIISRWGQNAPDKIIWRTPSLGNTFNLGTYQPKKIVEWIRNNYSQKEEVKLGIWLWTLR